MIKLRLSLKEIDYSFMFRYHATRVQSQKIVVKMKSCHQGHFMIEKGNLILRNSFFSAQRCWSHWFRCQLTNIKVNDCMVARINVLLTNDTLFQCELVCLHVHLLGSWSTTIKAARLQIKSYRWLFIFLHSIEYISLRTDWTFWNLTHESDRSRA